MTNEYVRINKYLAGRGICSRRNADSMILKGKVYINGEKAYPGMKVSPGDEVTLDGRPLDSCGQAEKVLIAFNKPRGIVCTSSEKDRAPNIVDYIGYKSLIFPVGRLDKDSRGLILLTNRGELVNLINRSSEDHEKEYLVCLKEAVTDGFLKKLAAGVEIELPQRDGNTKKIKTKKCLVRKKGKSSFYITLHEGKNRQIRRMCLALGNHVDTIKRLRIMNIRLGSLKEGCYRIVKGRELANFEKELGL